MTTSPTRATGMLALGQHMKRLIERGLIEDYSNTARRLGITRARVTQVVGLTLIAP